MHELSLTLSEALLLMITTPIAAAEVASWVDPQKTPLTPSTGCSYFLPLSWVKTTG